MLAYINDGSPVIWTGQPVRNVSHSLNIAELWTEAELNAAGLYRVVPFEVPAGQQITGGPTYALVGNEVQESYATEPIPPPTQADLITYANAKQWAVATSGRTVTVAGAPIYFNTSSESMGLMTGKAVRLQQPDPPATVQWQSGPTTFETIAAADFLAAATEIADFVQATFDALPGLIANIGNGTVTSMAQIDAVFDAL